jgi:hypothetical protein
LYLTPLVTKMFMGFNYFRTKTIDEILYYKVVQIWPGQTVTCLHTNSPGHIWTTLYLELNFEKYCQTFLKFTLRDFRENKYYLQGTQFLLFSTGDCVNWGDKNKEQAYSAVT